jgi:beta-lactamase regulating signal transducer with metallopeptidase domain
MDALLNWVWQGSVVAVALAVMLRLLERTRATARCALCWAALLLVISLPVVSWLAERTPRPGGLALVSEAAVVAVPDTWWTSGVAMLGAWFIWMGIQTALVVRALVSLRRARARRRPFPAQVAERLPHWSRVQQGGRRPALALSDSVSAAAVLGGGPPVIVVAPTLVSSLDAGEMDRVLIHEWAHVQRRDDLAQLLQLAVRVVGGWHPAVWWIDRRLHLEREIACDEMTVAITGSPKSYAACLVKLAGLRGAGRAPQAASAIFRAPGLRARVTKIVSGRASIDPLWSRGIAAAVASMLCVVSLAVAGIELVEPTVLAVPFESIPLQGDLPPVVAGFPARPAAVPVALEPAIRAGSPQPSRAPVAPAQADQRAAAAVFTQQTQQTQQTATSASPEPEAAMPVQPVPATEVVAKSPAPVLETGPGDAGASGTGEGRPSPSGAAAREKSPWAAAADGGTAVGRTSKDAGVATAGFFTRLARRVTGSF